MATAEQRIAELEQALEDCHNGRDHQVKKLNDGIMEFTIKFNALQTENETNKGTMNILINRRTQLERYVEKLKDQLRNNKIQPVDED